MAQTKHEILAILGQAQTEPRRRFGQNFMIDGNLVRLVAAAGGIEPGDTVLEVGPGTGTLTEELVLCGAEVIAVEIDRDLAGTLRSRMSDLSGFKLIEGDVLAGKHRLHAQVRQEIAAAKSRGRPVKLVANLPYNIASPLVIELLLAGLDLLVFTVQKELADRMRAQHGDDDYGPLSVMAQLLSEVEILRKLPPAAFWPAPAVESSLVRMTRRDQLGEHASDFGGFMHKIFSSRRKTLRKALVMAGLPAQQVLGIAGFDGQLRPEEFSPQQLLQLFKVVSRAS